MKKTPLDLLQDSDEIKACEVTSTTFPLLALAVGARGNDTAEIIYNNMMDFATHRGQQLPSVLVVPSAF